jgi:hypothetical protein
MEKSEIVKLVTGEVLLYWPSLWVKTAPKAKDGSDMGDRKYNTKILIKKKDKAQVKKIEDAVSECVRLNVKGIFDGKTPKNYNSPLIDGDDEKDETVHGYWVMNLKTERKPVVLDADSNEILDPEEIYGGCVAKVIIGFYAYNYGANSGVSAGLNGVKKIDDGERLDGSAGDVDSVRAEFDDELG